MREAELAIGQSRIDPALGHCVGDLVDETRRIAIAAARFCDIDFRQPDEMKADAFVIGRPAERTLGCECDPMSAKSLRFARTGG
jgi:hypothetical protein